MKPPKGANFVHVAPANDDDDDVAPATHNGGDDEPQIVEETCFATRKRYAGCVPFCIQCARASSASSAS